MKHVPNILTIIRLLLIGVFVYLFLGLHNNLAAMLVFAFAAFTDLLDGYIARKYNVISDFGKLMDPLADKLMLIAALACFLYKGMIPSFVLIFVIVKEALMILGGMVLYKGNIVVFSYKTGKYAAALFNLGVVLTFFYQYINPAHLICFLVAILLAVCAFFQYFTHFWKRRKELGKSEQYKPTDKE